jgi:iron complex outermembrane receptor protein
LLKVPASVIAISGAALVERGISGVSDLSAAVPNLSYAYVLGTPLPAIRGVGDQVAAGDAQQGVASYMDGLYLSVPSLAALALGDLERIEVLRGPQGTLYGRNSSGGAINYISNPPSDHPGGSLTVSYENYDTATVKGFITGPIAGDVLTGRLYADVRTADGYITNLAGGPKLGALNTTAGRAAVSFKPTPAFSADVSAFYQRDYGTYVDEQTLGRDGFPGSVEFLPGPGSYSTTPGVVNDAFPENDHRTAYGVAATLTGHVEGLTVKSITGYIDHNRSEFIDASGANHLTITFLPPPDNQLQGISGVVDSDETLSEEFNISGKVGPLDFVTGAYYAHESNKADNTVNFNATGPTATFPVFGFSFKRSETIETVAGFADLTYSVTDRLRLLAGGRFSHDTNDGVITEPVPGAEGQNCSAGQPYSISEDHFTPKIGVQYDVASHQNVYAQFSEGYKSGGTSQIGCGNFYKPENIDSYEIGYKATYLGGRISLNTAAFYYDYTNYQLQVIGPPPALGALIVNAPGVTSYGAEVDLAAQVTPIMRFEAGIGLLDAHYSKNFYDQDFFTFGRTAPVENLKGRVIIQAPAVTGNAATELALPVHWGPVNRLILRAEMNYSSSFSLRRFDRPFDIQPGYVIGSLFATVQSTDKVWSLRAFIRNLSDERYALGEIDNGATGLLNGAYSAPRTFGIAATMNF